MNSESTSTHVFVLEPNDELAASITSALNEAAPGATIDMARSLEEAQTLVVGAKPDLFVLDFDATHDFGQEFLLDLRTSHPDARAIILTATHLPERQKQAAGLGAVTFLEKPFPHGDFVDLVRVSMQPSNGERAEKFQGTLSDLHLADIIQLKCMSGATSTLEFTGPNGEKARVHFESGQIRHATAPGKQGVAAFNEIVGWKGGRIAEVQVAESPRTIDVPWQALLMEAVRTSDETVARKAAPRAANAKRKILVIDDSLMLLNFVKDILTEAHFQVTAVATAEAGMSSARENPPELILLDYVLPDMKGDEVSRKLAADNSTAAIPILYMSGFGTDLSGAASNSPNVIGVLNKPFTSDMLVKTVQDHLPKTEGDEVAEQPAETTTGETSFAPESDFAGVAAATTTEAPAAAETPWWNATPFTESAPVTEQQPSFAPIAAPVTFQGAADNTNAYFCGDTSFFSLTWALRTIAKEKLTGVLRCFWDKQPVEMYARDGKVGVVTTRDPELYCSEAPITLVNVDQDRIAAARSQQTQTGCPLFVTLGQEELILKEPAGQLVQHYGQKLFAQLWTAARVRFMFEQVALPPFVEGTEAEEDIDHWILSTLRFIQFQELGDRADYDVNLIPAYTRDGFERVQNLRLTVAEAQFASQFNGIRPIAQIAKNLRLDLKFARLTLFRFIAMEIVELWPPNTGEKIEKKGLFQRVGKSIGFGD